MNIYKLIKDLVKDKSDKKKHRINDNYIIPIVTKESHVGGIDQIPGTSKAESKIEEYLKSRCISFSREQTFNTLVNPASGELLRFDFYLPERNILIEYDGKQHFIYTPSIHGDDPIEGLHKLKQLQYRDKLKNEYCRDNNIRLIRLNATHYYRITETLNKLLN